MKRIEITFKDGSTSIEAYDETLMTAEQCFQVMSLLNIFSYVDDGCKTDCYREL